MDRRQIARDYFKKCNLTYDDIGINEIYLLIQILNAKIYKSNSCILMIKEPKLNGRYRNLKLINEKLKFAEIRVKGTYFEDREAITFNEDGFIGFCGWADRCNVIPFTEGFIEWCKCLRKRKIC